MATEYFPKEMILELIEEGVSDSGAHLVETEIIELSRWSAHYRIVFEFDGKVYACEYSSALTELQDERPFEYENEVECVEVQPVETTVIKYIEKE